MVGMWMGQRNGVGITSQAFIALRLARRILSLGRGRIFSGRREGGALSGFDV